MRDKHWTDDELVLKLFGVQPEDGHLEACDECARRWDIVRRRYEDRPTVFSEVPDRQLAAQRQAVRERLGSGKRNVRRMLAPSLATAFVVMLVALFLFKPVPPKPVPSDPLSEDELIEEVFRVSYGLEPAAITPMQ